MERILLDKRFYVNSTGSTQLDVIENTFYNKVKSHANRCEIQNLSKDSQCELINQTIGCARFIYNAMLYDFYENNIIKTPAKYKNDYPFLKDVDSLAFKLIVKWI